MSALLRYQAGILFRSHRWVLPLITYVLLLSVAGVGGKQPVSDGLDWSAAMLLPVVALLTRSMVMAEPGASRACVAAATGPRKAQLAVLITALAAGVVLAVAGAGYELVVDANAAHLLVTRPDVLVRELGAGLGRDLGSGLVKALICAFVGSAVATFCNPPVIRNQTVALLSTITAVVLGLVSTISPASAALRGNGGEVQSAAWPAGLPLLAAAGLLAVSWLASAVFAARRPD